MIKALNAKFIQSSTKISDAPDFFKTEIAFVGRSNVGKSSFINALVEQKGLAKSSSTPGKTQLINFFDVEFIQKSQKQTNDQAEVLNEKFSLIFVDLPGFGYAKVSKKTHDNWQKNLDEFIKERRNIKLFIHLIDARQFDLQIDKNLKEYLATFLRGDQKVVSFYTKSDKLNQSEKAKVLKFDPQAHFVSTMKNQGIDKARKIIVNLAFGKEINL